MIEQKLPEGIFSDFTKIKQWLEEETKLESGFSADRNTVIWKHGEHGANTLLLFRLNPAAVIVKSVEDNLCHAVPLGKIEPKKLIDTVCEKGIIREDKSNDKELIIDSFEQTMIGDIYHLIPDCKNRGGRYYGCQAGVLAQIKLAAACISALAESEHKVTIVLINETVVGAEGILGMLARIQPDSLIVSSSALSEKDFSSGKGPAVGIKDGNWVSEQTVWKPIQQHVSGTQTYIGSTGNILEKCYLTIKSKKIASIYLPIVGMGTRMDEIKKEDVEKTRKLLLKCIEFFGIMKR